MIDFKLVNPEVVNSEEKVFDKLWLKQLTIEAPSPTSEAGIRAEFVYYRHIFDEQGNVIGSEIKDDNKIDITIYNDKLFQLCTIDNNAKNAMDAMMLAINEEGMRQGIFLNDGTVTPYPQEDGELSNPISDSTYIPPPEVPEIPEVPEEDSSEV